MTETQNKFRDASLRVPCGIDEISDLHFMRDYRNLIKQVFTICADAADELPKLQAQVDAGEKATEGEWRQDGGYEDKYPTVHFGVKSGGVMLHKKTPNALEITKFITLSANNRAIIEKIVGGLGR